MPPENRTANTYSVRYFAVLRELAGCSQESVVSLAGTPAELYQELAAKRSLGWKRELLRAVVNERYVEMDAPLNDGDRVVFVPPVAGG
jgi:molybdopterin converting factor small subunit